MNHPNLSRELNQAISQSEQAQQVDLLTLKEGDIVEVQTHNSLYTLRFSNGQTIMDGGKFIPNPTLVEVAGATFGGSLLKAQIVFVGGFMEFYPEEGPHKGSQITTSRILRVSHQERNFAR